MKLSHQINSSSGKKSSDQSFSSENQSKSKAKINEFLKVFIRVRPINKTKYQICEQLKISTDTESITVTNSQEKSKRTSKKRNSKLNTTKTFFFNKVFKHNTNQEEIFENIMLSSFKNLLCNNDNSLTFAYGVSNAGKTYTILGTPELPGLLERSIFLSLNINESFKDITSNKSQGNVD